MPGQEYGNAIADVLFGTVNPSARLPITFPNKENEVGMSQDQYPGTKGISVYSEGMEVGYRWYNAHNVKPAFAFGHGLSYTQFEYSDLQINQRSVSVKIHNTGDVDGAEVPQLYLGFPTSAHEPPKQLKGFQKVHLKAGKKAKVTFPLTDRDFSIWDFSLPPAIAPTEPLSKTLTIATIISRPLLLQVLWTTAVHFARQILTATRTHWLTELAG